MDGWIDHTPLDCCDYWSTAFQNRSADNDDDDVANSIVGVYVTTIVIMIVMMHLIQQPGLPHNYAPPSSLHNSQTLGRIPSHVNQARGRKNTQIPHRDRKITPLIPSHSASLHPGAWERYWEGFQRQRGRILQLHCAPHQPWYLHTIPIPVAELR